MPPQSAVPTVVVAQAMPAQVNAVPVVCNAVPVYGQQQQQYGAIGQPQYAMSGAPQPQVVVVQTMQQRVPPGAPPGGHWIDDNCKFLGHTAA